MKSGSSRATLVNTTPSVGQYQPLYLYLRDRFANRVVLTFQEIEDLLGSALPEAARREQAWWSSGGDAIGDQEHSRAWTLAKRRAEVRLSARCVVFDRDEVLKPLPGR